MKLEESVEIAAPAALVWQVLTDLPRYGEWNPFVVAAESTLKTGDPIRMRVRLFARFTQPQTETVREVESGRRLCYGLAPQPLGALSSRRCHELEATSPAGCRYHSRFALEGWLAPLVAALMGGRLRHGFAANTRALKLRAEALAAAERDTSRHSAA